MLMLNALDKNTYNECIIKDRRLCTIISCVLKIEQYGQIRKREDSKEKGIEGDC